MAEIPEWAAKKAAELANVGRGPNDNEWHSGHTKDYGIMSAFARYIAEHETAPVDPDVLAVREILEAWDAGSAYLLNEGQDPEFDRALAAYREHASKRNG